MKQDIQQNEKLAGNKMLSQQVDEQQVGRGSKRRASLDQYDELIGAIDQGTSSTRFLVFERGTGRLIASSQLEIKRITPREGWVEIDPNSIMSSVYATMANVHDQLKAKLGLDQTSSTGELQQLTNETSSFMGQKCLAPQMLRCIGICNQRESAVVWDSKTGQPLYNVIVWMDNRTKDIVDEMIDSIPGRNFNHLKDKTGLPMSTYFSAFKLRWLIDNVPEVQEALREKRLLVGTVDSWILWNLTGRHLTDVTNASRTFLMDIETLQWDKTLCKQFKVPINILPRILSSADDFGAIQFGPFMGTPVTGVIGDQSAALFGHNCLQLGQTKATFGTGCFIMQNIGPGPLNGALAGVQREAKRGLITTVGYKLKDKPVCYALEGSIKIAGAALTWLRDNMQLIQNYEECDQLVNTTTNSAGVFFVPALGGLYSPYWDPNAAGLFIGLSQFTRREHLVRATFDSIAFQTNDILSLMRGVTNGLMIDGGLCKSDNLCQIMADITGCEIVRPSMCETSALGAAMVAGCGAGIWDYDSMMAHSNMPHEYACSSNQTHHYPHESLNYDENKFAHSLHHQAQAAPRCFKSTAGKQATNQEEQHQEQQQQQPHQTNEKRADSQEVQHQQQPSKLHRRSLRHRNGGRLMRNLDAGGGINDDAGGGGGGGDGGRNTGAPSATRHSVIYSSEEDDAYSSAGHVAGSDTDFEQAAASQGTTSSASSSSEFAGPQQPTIENNPSFPAVIEGLGVQSSGESSANQLARSVEQAAKTRTLANLINNLNVQQGAPASSSGYSSGDNFESASTSCALTDSLRLSDGRTESPLSQTNTGRDSVATFTDSINDKRHQNTDQADSLASNSTPSDSKRSSVHLTASNSHETTPAPVTFPFSLTNFMDQQRADSAAFAARAQQQEHDHEQEQALEQQEAANPNEPDATLNTMVVPVVQQVNNMKFAENAEDVAAEVHEFGGRDSYGEDGYDSSTLSFDSYDDDGEMGILQDVLMLQHEAEVAYYADHNGEVEPDRRLADATLATHCDVASNKSTVIQSAVVPIDGAANQSGGHQHHNRRRQASLLDKQMDIFQSYISLEHRTELVDTWRAAVSRSMQWTKVHHEEVRRIDYQRLSSLPISMYVFFSLGLVALSGCLSPNSLIGN